MTLKKSISQINKLIIGYYKIINAGVHSFSISITHLLIAYLETLHDFEKVS